ncbi:MAG: hypothetical protein AAF787_06855 [Chloroflexota bacterium]
MTTTYTNITLLDVDQPEAAAWLAENSYTAAVSPTIDDITVVYDTVLADHADDDEPLEHLLRLASEMSYELGCMAWLVIVEADAVLIYSFYSDGELTDSYGAPPDEAPDGGDAEMLVDAFDLPKRAVKTVRTALKREMRSATERHEKLLAALEAPALALRCGYESIKAGELPTGVDSADDLIFVDVDDDEATEDDNA